MSTSSPQTPMQEWLGEERGRAARLAKRQRVSTSHISNIAAGHSRPGNELLIGIHAFAGGRLSFEDILAPWMQDNNHAPDVVVADGATPSQSATDCEAAS